VRGKRYKGINTVKRELADGSIKVYRYDRKSGTQLSGAPGSKQFDDSLQAARSGAKKVKDPETMGDLVTLFKGSAEYTTKSDATKRDYNRYMDEIRSEFGSMPKAALEDKGVRQEFYAWRDKHAHTPRAADYRWSVLQRVLSIAKKRGQIATNHAVAPGDLYDSDRSEIIWEPQDVAAFMAAAPLELQRVMAFALFTGQRQGELRRLTWTNVCLDGITFHRRRKGKLQRTVFVPIHRDFRPIVDGIARTSPNVLTTKRGVAWTADNLKNRWFEAFCSANLWSTGLHFHDLRGTAVTLLSEAGCTTHEIASITGHTLKTVETILEKYSARTRILALAAMRKLENAQSTILQNASGILQNASTVRSTDSG
jgi:integrase